MAPAPWLDPSTRPPDGETLWVEAPDRARLRAGLFQPAVSPEGSVIVSPGRGEPIEKYAEVIGELQGRGYVVLIHDWRGQGLSTFARGGERSRGHARGWRRFVSDLETLLRSLGPRLPRPWIALGHSMGGGLTLLAMAERCVDFDGAVLSAPMLGVRLGRRSPLLVRTVCRLVNLAGLSTLPTPPTSGRVDTGEGEVLTHDRARWAGFQALREAHPELHLGRPTWGWLAFAFVLADRLREMRTLERVTVPVTLVAAEYDVLVAAAPQRAAMARLPAGRYVEVKGAFHEILMETDSRRAVFWSAFDELAAQVSGRMSQSA